MVANQNISCGVFVILGVVNMRSHDSDSSYPKAPIFRDDLL